MYIYIYVFICIHIFTFIGYMCPHIYLIDMRPHIYHITRMCTYIGCTCPHIYYICTYIGDTQIHIDQIYVDLTHTYHTVWRRLIGSPKLQIILHKRATKCRSLLRKMTYKDKASYESSPPCIKMCPHICHIDTYVYIYVSTYIQYMHIYWIYIDPHICESNTYISYRDVSIYLSYRHVCVHILDICVHIYITYAHI